MNHSTRTLFKGAIVLLFVAFGFSSNAQTIYTKRQNVSYKKSHSAESEAAANSATAAAAAEEAAVNKADFTLFTYPLRGTSYLSVKSAIPNQIVKVVVYDITGKIIYNEMVPTGNKGKFEIQVDPKMDFTPGDGFIAALYHNRAFYESIPLDK